MLEITISFFGIASIEPSSSASLASSVVFSSAMYFSRSSIGASSTSSSESGAAGWPLASGTARAARCSSTSASSAVIWLCSSRTCGLDAL